jgi:hypothetical protein
MTVIPRTEVKDLVVHSSTTPIHMPRIWLGPFGDKVQYTHADAVSPCRLHEAGAYHARGKHPGIAAPCNTYPQSRTTIMHALMITKPFMPTLCLN